MSDPARDLALRRLEASRERLQRRLAPAPDRPPGHAAWPRRIVSLALRWWHHQPWHGGAERIGATLGTELRPIVRAHPVLAVGIAAALGATIVALRPWRWQPLVHATWPVLRRARHWALLQLGSAPVQMAISAWVASWLARAPQAAAKPEEPARPEA